MSLMLKDLSVNPDKNIKEGDKVFLIRKISGHVLETKLLSIGSQGRPHCEVQWVKDKSDCYRLDLEKNTVNAIDASPRHRQEMLRLWEIWEPVRLVLIDAFYKNKKTSKR